MSYSRPDPPDELPRELTKTIDEFTVQELRKLASYAASLAEYREREERLDSQENPHRNEQQTDLPEGVPSKATLTIKEINDNRYYYWQWREGDTIKSKYKGPVSPKE